MFDDIDPFVLEEIVEAYAGIHSLFQAPCLLTVATVPSEMKRLLKMLCQRFAYFNRDSIVAFGSGRKIALRNKKIQETFKQKALLGELIDKCRRSVRLARKKVFKPRDEQIYDALTKTVFLLAKNTDAKRNYNLRHGRLSSQTMPDLHTDEQLVAAAYQLAVENYLHQEAKAGGCSIVTHDSDIQRLVKAVHDFICNSTIINAAVKEFSIRVFYRHTRESIICNVDTLVGYFHNQLCSYSVLADAKAVQEGVKAILLNVDLV